MTRAEIQKWFPPTPGMVMTHFGGLEYAVPTVNWLQTKFWDYFSKRLWDSNVSKWKVRWECRDFARAYACMAQECWANTVGVDSPADALAVGEIWFRQYPNELTKPGHAVCPAITDRGLVFIEPQNNTLCEMSSEQLASRYFLRF